MARTQTIVQFTDDLLATLDQHAAATGRSRSEVIRSAVEVYLDGLAESEADRRLVESYKRVPQEDLGAGDEDARQLVDEEPW